MTNQSPKHPKKRKKGKRRPSPLKEKRNQRIHAMSSRKSSID
jgi:hypothetical protein